MNGLRGALLCSFVLSCSTFSVHAAEELNIKGSRIGMTEQEVRALVGEPFTCVSAAQIDEGMRRCGKAGTMADSYAGLHVDIMRLFRDGKLVTVYVGGLKPADFDTVEEALIEKFGKPRTERGDAQNGFGAHFDTVDHTWTSSTAVLRFKKRCGKVSDSCLVLLSPEEAERESDKKKEKARSDM